VRWLKCRDAAVYAGGVGEKTLYSAARAGKLRVARIGAGRNWITNEAWVDAWLMTSSTAAPDDRNDPQQRDERGTGRPSGDALASRS
jgi:hypothetical protein